MSVTTTIPAHTRPLRFTTAGSVDDGKSTLIGRLLHDLRVLHPDQLEALEAASTRAGKTGLDLSLLTDGLAAEREQGITIDVAYRYFSTARRSFILADTPGHEQYTRNMVTGASTADVALVLVDASRGVQPQTKRHLHLASLLALPHVILVVNKMDRVRYDERTFTGIRGDLGELVSRLGFERVEIVPVSALEGDMIVERGAHLPWYHGPTLAELLEQAPLVSAESGPFRFPVQLVARARFGEAGWRGYFGTVPSGWVRVGDEVTVMPTEQPARVAQLWLGECPVTAAEASQAVTLVLDRQLDVSRGATIVGRPAPGACRAFGAKLAWLNERPLSARSRYLIKSATQTTRVLVRSIESVVDINGGPPRRSETLEVNDIGEVLIDSAQPLALDAYAEVRQTGCFILIDETSSDTVAAGMVTRLY
jgi:sulfate adenylyltransferase subunit 1